MTEFTGADTFPPPPPPSDPPRSPTPLTTAPSAHPPPAKGKAEKKATPKKKAPRSARKDAREGSKTAAILDLLKRPNGATAKELLKATGWQPHSLRGFISGTLGKKMGLTVTSTKGEDGRQQAIDFARIEASEAKIEVRLLDLLKLQCQ